MGNGQNNQNWERQEFSLENLRTIKIKDIMMWWTGSI